MKNILKELNMTIRQFSEKYEIPYNTVRQWERGLNSPPKYVMNLLREKIDREKNGEQIEIKFKCENCYHYEFEEDEYGNRYHYCRYFDCQLNEIAGLNDCENYDQMSTWGKEER